MQIRTLLRYLIGDRQAILELAASRWALPVGALFVLSAGLAREYDGEDLLHEPWHLLIPFGASLLASLVLFRLAWWEGDYLSEKWPKFFPAYQSFLGLFWMTAPLAWLYAIPYERFLPPVEAARANLLTLALVATWRVVLMMRVLTVLLDFRFIRALILVMPFANGIALLALCFLPFPVIDVMSGIRLPETDKVVFNVSLYVFVFGFWTGPFWFIAWIALLGSRRPAWQALPPEVIKQPSRSLWILAIGSVVIWAVVLPFTQPEQQLRWRVEQEYRAERYGAMLAEMSAHSPEDFPPYWQAPSRYTNRFPKGGKEQLLSIWEKIAEKPPAQWVRQIYLSRLRELLQSHRFSGEDPERLGQLLGKLPEGPDLVCDLTCDEQEQNLELLRPHLPKSLQKNATKGDSLANPHLAPLPDR